MLGVVTRVDLQLHVDAAQADETRELRSIIRARPVVAFPDEPLSVIVHRMAETALTRFPVVERTSGKLLGMIALDDLLKARALNLDAEHRRERVLKVRFAFPSLRKP